MNYDLQDSYDISRLENDFSLVSISEWEQYMAFSGEGDNWKRFDKKGIYVGLKNAGRTRNVSPVLLDLSLKKIFARLLIVRIFANY